MSKGRLARLQKKINAASKASSAAVEATSAVRVPVTYGIRVNGRKFRAIAHNTTETLFIVHDASGVLHFYPLRRLRKVVIGAEYTEFRRQQALATVPKVPPDKLTVVRRPGLVIPSTDVGVDPEGA